jgi:PAS domain S-box-containing protein
MPEQEDSTDPAAGELAAAVQGSALPVALLDLVFWRVIALSAGAAAILGIEPTATNVDVRDLATDPENARRRLEAIHTGLVDAYQARLSFRRHSGETVEFVVWVRAIDAERTLAILVFVADGDAQPVVADDTAAVGTLDDALRIRQISSDVTGLLGYAPEACVGRSLESLVHPSDVGALFEVLSRATSDQTNIAINVRIRASDGSWRPLRLTVGPTGDETTSFGFGAVPDDPVTDDPGQSLVDRVAELEQHLARIARELEAAGMVGRIGLTPDPERVPALGDLSSRQWQILTRLLRGERVPTIANAMYVSASTIRNHLSMIYKKLGVHSQAELIEKFRLSD